MRRTSVLGLCVLLAAGPAAATPSFEAVVTTGAVTQLAVGETLQFYAYPPECHRDRKAPPTPLSVPLTWSVEPVGSARITKAGLLTALEAGGVVVKVTPGLGMDGTSVAMPGEWRGVIAKEVPGGRLPRLEGGPKLQELEHFTVEWDRSSKEKERGLVVSAATLSWRLTVSTVAPPAAPMPWTLEFVPERSEFDVESHICLLTPGQAERARAALLLARLTLSGWKEGVATGRLLIETSRGVAFDAAFVARLPDRDGALAKASEPKDAAPPR